MDRCKRAYELHKSGYNCCQAVAGAFADRLPAEEAAVFAAAGGFGGGVGGSHQEVCGAVSGGVLVLSWLYPHTQGADQEAKRRLYGFCREYRRRFEEVFGRTRCGELLSAKPGLSAKTPAAERLGVTAHCDIMIVTAVELLEAFLAEIEGNS